MIWWNYSCCHKIHLSNTRSWFTWTIKMLWFIFSACCPWIKQNSSSRRGGRLITHMFLNSANTKRPFHIIAWTSNRTVLLQLAHMHFFFRRIHSTWRTFDMNYIYVPNRFQSQNLIESRILSDCQYSVLSKPAFCATSIWVLVGWLLFALLLNANCGTKQTGKLTKSPWISHIVSTRKASIWMRLLVSAGSFTQIP